MTGLSFVMRFFLYGDNVQTLNIFLFRLKRSEMNILNLEYLIIQMSKFN